MPQSTQRGPTARPHATAQHTPGPWRALDKSVTPDTTDLSCIGAIATCHVRRSAQPLITAEQARANAKLIAAAPALADALEAILANEYVGDRYLPAAKAALRLAGRLP